MLGPGGTRGREHTARRPWHRAELDCSHEGGAGEPTPPAGRGQHQVTQSSPGPPHMLARHVGVWGRVVLTEKNPPSVCRQWDRQRSFARFTQDPVLCMWAAPRNGSRGTLKEAQTQGSFWETRGGVCSVLRGQACAESGRGGRAPVGVLGGDTYPGCPASAGSAGCAGRSCGRGGGRRRSTGSRPATAPAGAAGPSGRRAR